MRSDRGCPSNRFQVKTRAISRLRVGTVADDERSNSFSSILPHAQEGGPFGGTEPLVAVSGVIGSAELCRDRGPHARPMRAIHQHIHAAELHFVHKTLNRQHQTRLARDMVNQKKARPGGHTFEDRLEEVIPGLQGKGTGATTTVAPKPPATASTALRQALYS